MQNDEILHKWINKTISEEELEAFKQREEYDSLVQLYQQTDGLAAPDFGAEEMLQQILKTQKARSTDKVVPIGGRARQKRNFPVWLMLAVAASFFIGGFLFLLPTHSVHHFQTGLAETIEKSLPDGSTFVLAQNSTLTYDGEDWKTSRDLTLDGEAFFDVQKGSTFTVNTDIGKVEVLGTQFTVVSRSGELKVDCKEGRVKVSSLDNTYSGIITASEELFISEEGAMQISKSNNTSLKGVTFGEVIKALERVFEVEINVVDVDLSKKISCNFQHSKLESALRTTTAPLGTKYEIVNDQLVKIFK